MPVVYRRDGCVFRILPNDHQPAHVHVQKAEAELRIDISSAEPSLLSVEGRISNKQVRKAFMIAAQQLPLLLRHWEETRVSTF
jgi:hypothetical protein